jgi:hypothetical protein
MDSRKENVSSSQQTQKSSKMSSGQAYDASEGLISSNSNANPASKLYKKDSSTKNLIAFLNTFQSNNTPKETSTATSASKAESSKTSSSTTIEGPLVFSFDINVNLCDGKTTSSHQTQVSSSHFSVNSNNHQPASKENSTSTIISGPLSFAFVINVNIRDVAGSSNHQVQVEPQNGTTMKNIFKKTQTNPFKAAPSAAPSSRVPFDASKNNIPRSSSPQMPENSGAALGLKFFKGELRCT